jgi:hypothetical protein
MNWKNSTLAKSVDENDENSRVTFYVDEDNFKDDNQYAVKKIFEDYIDLDDDVVPAAKYIPDGTIIDADEHCGSQNHYNFIMSFGSEPICENVLSKYPEYIFPPDIENKIGGLVPNSWNFWESLREADAEFDTELSPNFEQEFEEKFFNFEHRPNFVQDVKRKILCEGKNFQETFNVNEFEAIMGMVQVYGVGLFKDLANIAEILGLGGLMKLACLNIGQQTRYWPEVEDAIQEIYQLQQEQMFQPIIQPVVHYESS